MRPRGIAGALFVVAVGAILAYAVHYTVVGISIRTVGFIVMAAGAVALAAVLARALTDSQRQNRLEDRQDELLRAPSRPAPGIERGDRMYARNPGKAVPPAAQVNSVSAADLVPGQRVGETPRAAAPHRTPESGQR